MEDTAIDRPIMTSPTPKARNAINAHHMAASWALSLMNRNCPSYITDSTSSAEREGLDDSVLVP